MKKLVSIFLKRTLRYLLAVAVLVILFQLWMRDKRNELFYSYKIAYEDHLQLLEGQSVRRVFENITIIEKTSNRKLVLIEDFGYLKQNGLAISRQLNFEKVIEKNQLSADDGPLCPYIPSNLSKFKSKYYAF
jgi:hypothetical protein